MGYFLWFIVLPVCIVLLFFLLMFIVDKLVKKEAISPEFARKMDRFRYWVGRFTPSSGIKQFIIVVLFLAFMIWGASHSYYDE